MLTILRRWWRAVQTRRAARRRLRSPRCCIAVSVRQPFATHVALGDTTFAPAIQPLGTAWRVVWLHAIRQSEHYVTPLDPRAYPKGVILAQAEARSIWHSGQTWWEFRDVSPLAKPRPVRPEEFGVRYGRIFEWRALDSRR